MREIWQVCRGEVVKQNQNYYNTWQTYISLGIWPILNCITTYFMYQAFPLKQLEKYGLDSQSSLLVFIFTGFLGYNCFWAMVQSALFMQTERQNGTIEIVFLSPANRLAIVYGRALGGVFQNIWMFFLFTIFIVMFRNGISISMLLYVPLGFIILVISATLWGGFINSIFLLSRDINFWFTLCDAPMEILSGVKIPVLAFPSFLQWISVIFPLTHCLVIIRGIFMEMPARGTHWLSLLVVQLVLFLITKCILWVAERNNRKTGNLQLY